MYHTSIVEFKAFARRNEGETSIDKQTMAKSKDSGGTNADNTASF